MKAMILLAALLGLTTLFAGGCGQANTERPQAETAPPDNHDHDHDTHTVSSGKVEAAHDHSGWWCNEHGVPEEVCSLCDSRVAAEFQKKGDWCAEHDRADSQCFHCHPELEARFAAQYEARYGKQPPKPEG